MPPSRLLEQLRKEGPSCLSVSVVNPSAGIPFVCFVGKKSEFRVTDFEARIRAHQRDP